MEQTDELGAHVSTTGGCDRAHARAAALEAVVLQLFTKQPQRWAEPSVGEAQAAAFRAEREKYGIQTVLSHESYLPNLATPDEALFAQSYRSFVAELERCKAYGIDYLVSHPGNATDGDRARGLRQNAEAYARAIAEVESETMVLIETTAGQGNVLGSTFEEIAQLIEDIPEPARSRVGVCLDTCHVFVAGYDLRNDYDGVVQRFDEVIGLERLLAFHLNDSKGDLGSHRDRHEGIGEGFLGPEPFRRLMRDERFRRIPKLLETPKGDDALAADRLNLGRLRSYRA